jgi:hypothetical protein
MAFYSDTKRIFRGLRLNGYDMHPDNSCQRRNVRPPRARSRPWKKKIARPAFSGSAFAMTTPRAKAFAIALATVAAVVVIGVLIRMRVQQVTGLPPTYDARDRDPRLSREAATAQLLIDALARYRAEHGQFPSDILATGVSAHDWVYATQPSGYTLSKKLGWDPVLHFRFEQNRGRWVFEPGDGSPEREITL